MAMSANPTASIHPARASEPTVLQPSVEAGTEAGIRKNNEGRRVHRFVFWLPALGLVALFGWIGRWVFWVADDFCRGAASRDLGLIGIQTAEYQNWSGRYTFNAFIGLATRFGVNASHLAPPILAALSLGISTALARRLPELLMPKRYAPLLGFVGCLCLFGLFENFGQSVLWLTGGLTYTAPFLLLASALLLAFPTTENPRLAKVSRVFAAVLTLLAVGCNEAIGAAIVGSLIVVVMFNGKRIRRRLFPLTIFSFLGFAIMAAAPGNNVRRTFTRPRKLSELPISAATDTFRLFIWLVSQRTFLVCVAIGAGLILGKTLGKRPGLGMLSGSLLVGVPYGTDLLGFIGTGDRLVQRARIAVLVPMFVGLILVFWFAGSRSTRRVSTLNDRRTRLWMLFAFAIAVSAIRSVLPAAAAAYNSSDMAEQTTERLSQGSGTTIPIAVPGPGTIWGLPNFTGDGDWALRCADNYFNVKGTYLELKK
jgi:Family of unknown function (DUF6056)